jgi:KaiC/GvpD/RAD55 family RecA-like ATPase
MSPDVMDAAKAAMRRGWAVFPVNGKVPATAHGLKDASTDESLADIWFSRFPDRGVALATGRVSGVFAVDLDSPEALARFRALQQEMGKMPTTPVSITGRGYHVLFRMPIDGDVRNSAGKLGEGIDVRGSGGYIVLPPSPHPAGASYRWKSGRSPDDVEPADAPNWLLEMIQDAAPEATAAPPVDGIIPAGARNDTLTSLAGSMRRRGMTEDEILAALEATNRRCVPPLERADLQGIARSVCRYEPAAPVMVSGNGRPAAPEMELIGREVLARIRDDKLKPLSVVPTPWPMWNRVCRGAGGGRGLAHGWHVIVGAASGSGKSLAATNMAASAIRQGEDVCLLSLEMSQAEVVTRLLSIFSGTEARKLEHGPQFCPDAWDSASELLGEASGSIHVNHDPLGTLEQIEKAIREYAARGCRTMIVDYLQLAWVHSAETMHAQIVEVSHTIRGLARELGVLSIGLSQVNRQQSFAGGELRKEGLLGGSSLENDADQVLLLGKPEPAGLDYRSAVRLDKNRHGPPAEWEIELNARTLRMIEVMPDHQPHVTVG